jgi:hypothetical protein
MLAMFEKKHLRETHEINSVEVTSKQSVLQNNGAYNLY